MEGTGQEIRKNEMGRDSFLNELVSVPLKDFSCLNDFYSGIESMDSFIIKEIAIQARSQTFAGCQFLIVEALATKEYSAVGFYERCGFTANEVKKPFKDTLRMYMTLYEKNTDWDEEDF